MTINQSKKSLRIKVKKKAASLPVDYFLSSGKAISEKLTKLKQYENATVVSCFVSGTGEADLSEFLKCTLKQNKTLCVPRCDAPGVMSMRKITNLNELKKGKFDIPEPADEAEIINADDIELAVIPCLSAAKNRKRLGKGGGFYDRFLASYKGFSVCVCPEKLISDEVPTESHDITPDILLTENKIY